MKIKLLVVGLVAFLLMTATASAFQYRMRYGQAKHATLQYTRELCEGIRECQGYAVGQCYRASLSRFDCTEGTFFPGTEPGEEVVCTGVLHWGVGKGGFMELKSAGKPHCSTVE